MNNRTPILSLHGVNTHYGAVHILKDVDIDIYPGEMVSLLGGNASGKTTTLKTILGYVKPTQGTVTLNGEEVNEWSTAERVGSGVTMVPENRRLFKRMTVKENLEIGAYLRPKDDLSDDYDKIFELFPRVKERLSQKAGTLSGGEQQMLAIARALLAEPELLIMDEPSLGLAPMLIEQIRDIVVDINKQGVSVLLIEQNAMMALSIADFGYVMESGKVVMDGPAQKLLGDEDVQEFYLGLHGEGGERKSFRDVKHYKRRKRWLS